MGALPRSTGWILRRLLPGEVASTVVEELENEYLERGEGSPA